MIKTNTKLAFPSPKQELYYGGLTKREWLAAHALVGIMAQAHVPLSCAQLADEAVACADALLAKLEETEGGA